jgi:hypothetical protein
VLLEARERIEDASARCLAQMPEEMLAVLRAMLRER